MANVNRIAMQQIFLTHLDDSEDDNLEFAWNQQSNNLNQAMVEHRGVHESSRPGRAPYRKRDREAGHERIWRDYFCDTPVYDDVLFRRRFRMRRSLFNRITAVICVHDDYFTQRRDLTGRLGLSSIQKVIATLKMLAYGVAAGQTDEYLRIGESTAMESMKRFVRAIREIYEAHYLRVPTMEDVAGQMRINQARGWPGMFASIDCMHYEWKNCPIAWERDFQNKEGNCSIVLEAITDQSLYFWHAYFGLPRSNNDISVLDRSPLVSNLLRSDCEDLTFEVLGTRYPRYYLLDDSIYPNWSIFVQTILKPQSEKRRNFSREQEGARKDVERAFGVLQARFAIIKNPCRQWDMLLVKDICIACVLLHNLIVEDERDLTLESLFDTIPPPIVRRHLTFERLHQSSKELEDIATHYTLRNDLIEHLWAVKGNVS